MNEKILLVDDEPDILKAYERVLRKLFDVETAPGGEAGLAAAAEHGPFAVVMSDLRMPAMDGVQFLARVREAHPETVRMMLTGQADLDAAMDAVNEGNIFRFLTKPCPVETLSKALNAGIEQYRLVRAEKELLESTLRGVMRMLTELLSLTNPAAFGRASRVRRLVARLAAEMKPEKPWEWEIAAMLSHVGCVTVPNEILEKLSTGVALTPAELRMFCEHPRIGADLIANVPRLEAIADIVRYQEEFHDGAGAPDDGPPREAIPLGARVLKVALTFDTLTSKGKPAWLALAEMRQAARRYDPAVLNALHNVLQSEPACSVRAIALEDFEPGMVIAQDIRTVKGTLLISKGQEVTLSVRRRLLNLSQSFEIRQPIQVEEPENKTSQA